MKVLRAVLSAVLLCCLLWSGWQLVHYAVTRSKESALLEELAAPLEQLPDTQGARSSYYRQLARQNPDLIGWIALPGTELNYPVMHTPDRPNYYLKRNFQGEYSDLGTPYLQENCQPGISDNLILHGHHMNDGKMFAVLEQYKEQTFWQEHPFLQFDTLQEQGRYAVMAVFVVPVGQPGAFAYQDFVQAENPEQFRDFVSACQELSLYDTGVTAAYGDTLLTLSTCEYTAPQNRIVVVAVKIEE